MQQPPNPYPQYPQQQWQTPSQPLPPQQQWQQQPSYTQTQSYFPPPPNPQQQQQSKLQQFDKPPTSHTSRSRTWLWILIALIVGMVIGYAIHVPGVQSTPDSTTTTTTQNISQTTSQPTQVPTPTHPAATPTPTHTPTWTTTHTFTGNGTKKTGFFTVPDNWKLIWKCDPNSEYGGQYNVQVFVYSSDGSLTDLAVNTICQAGNTGDSTDEHQGGQIYLDINSEAAWTIQVQELK